MKSRAGKKKQVADRSRPANVQCGTMAYIALSRGTAQMTRLTSAPPYDAISNSKRRPPVG